jgi:hypothetical protein
VSFVAYPLKVTVVSGRATLPKLEKVPPSVSSLGVYKSRLGEGGSTRHRGMLS